MNHLFLSKQFFTPLANVQGSNVPSTTSAIISNGFFTVNREWIVTCWNKASEKLLRVESKDILGQNIWEQFYRQLPVEFYASYYKGFQLESPVFFEEYWAEMGSWFNGVIYPEADSLSVSFTCSNQPGNPDQKEKVLRELYLFVTEVTNDCLWEWDLLSKQIFWIDGGHRRIFGYPVENALVPQSYWENHIHPEDKERLLYRLQQILTNGTTDSWEDEYRLKKANGLYAYVHDRGHIFYNDDHQAIRMIGATQDISKRKIAELQLLETEQRLSLIAKQTSNAVIITDIDGKIIWLNNAFSTITGYTNQESMGRKPGDFLQGAETDTATIQYLRQQINDRLPFDCKIINYHKSGKKYWVHIQGQAFFDTKGNCERFFAIQADITEKVTLENKLIEERIANQRIITEAVLTAQENERENIGKELHDNLNQLLAVAKLYIQMARKTADDKQEMYLSKSSDLILNVIDEIRRISKSLVIPGMHEIGLLDNIRNLISNISDIYPIQFTFTANEHISSLLDTKRQLSFFRIVQEQLNNILKHADATEVVINISLIDQQVVLEISDNGNGTNTYTATEGVGVINIKSRVALYDGVVSITSKPGKGYSMQVSIPINETMSI